MFDKIKAKDWFLDGVLLILIGIIGILLEIPSLIILLIAIVFCLVMFYIDTKD